MSDAFFSNVVSLLHFDGADASASFSDVKGKTWARTGTPTISTAQSKFGGASGVFSGGGQYIETPSSADFAFGSGDFTVEGWFRPTSSAASNYYALIARDNVAGARGWLLFTDITTGNLNFTAWSGGISKTAVRAGNFLADFLNTWAHVAVSRVGNTMRLFVNGVLAGSVDVTGFSVADNNEVLRIASLKGVGGADPFFAGYVDDVRITKGIGRYSAGFTPPTEAFPDTGPIEIPSTVGVVSLMHFNGGAGSQVMADVLGKSWTVFGNTQLSAAQLKFGASSAYFDGVGDCIASASADFGFGSGDWTWEAWVRPEIVSGGDANFANVASLLHFDGLNASTTFADVKGKTWTAFGNAQISTAQSKFGGASGLFDGAGAYVQAAGSSDFDFGSGAFTIEAWVRTAAAVSATRIIFNVAGNAGARSYVFGVAATNKLYFGYSTDGTALVDLVSADNAIPVSTFAHLAVTRSGSTITGWVNGASVFTATFAGSIFSAPSQPAQIGGRSVSSQWFNGHIDDLRVTKGVARYTAAFTPPAAAFDDSGPANMVLFDTRAAALPGIGVYQNIAASGAKWGVRTNADVGAEGSVLTADTWAHLAVSKQGATIRGFKDGVLDFTYTDSRTYASSALAFVGANAGASEFYKGYLDEMRVTKGQARYTAAFTPATAAFPDPIDPDWAKVVSLLHFEGADGSTVFTDETGRTWAAAGNAQIDTAQFKFGSSAGLFDGSGDWIVSASSEAFNILPGDFTLEFFCRYGSAAGNQGIVEGYLNSTNRWNVSLVSGALVFYTLVGGTGSIKITTTAPAIDTWHHIALVKSGSTFTLYVNGAAAGTSTTTSFYAGAVALYVGTAAAGTDNFNGHVDELRITKGFARYTANFTPPAEPFPAGLPVGGGTAAPATRAYGFVA